MTIKDAPRSRDQQVKLMKEALEVPMTDELRAMLEARLSELQAAGPPDAVPMEKAPSESHLPSAGRHIPKDRDTKIRMIQEWLKGPVSLDMRNKLTRLLAELQGEAPPETVTRELELPPLAREVISETTTSGEAPAKRKVKIW